MRFRSLLLVLLGLAAAPLAPAAERTSPTAECAAKCCQTKPDCCATSCPCPPLSCQAPSTPAVVPPVTKSVFFFVPVSPRSGPVSDETCSVRTDRPPVPPPRA